MGALVRFRGVGTRDQLANQHVAGFTAFVLKAIVAAQTPDDTHTYLHIPTHTTNRLSRVCVCMQLQSFWGRLAGKVRPLAFNE